VTHRSRRLLWGAPFAGHGWSRQFLPPALFFLTAWGIERHGCGEAFIDPAPRLQLAAHGRVADVAGVRDEIMAYEVDGPALLHRADVAGTLGSQALKVCGDALAFGGWTSGLGGVGQSWESSRLVGFEPGAHGVFMAV
jgi:hypothetical protein